MPDQLRKLALSPGWIYEAIVCTFSGRDPHAAPVGVWTVDQRTLVMDLYSTSHTLAHILDSRQFVVDFPPDAMTLFKALYAPHRLRFDTGDLVHAPRLADSSATVELSLTDTSRSDPVRVRGRVEGIRRRGDLRLINRAESLVTESLILATRAERLGRDVTLARLEENARVVTKVAPGSHWAEAMGRLLDDARAGS